MGGGGCNSGCGGGDVVGGGGGGDGDGVGGGGGDGEDEGGGIDCVCSAARLTVFLTATPVMPITRATRSYGL